MKYGKDNKYNVTADAVKYANTSINLFFEFICFVKGFFTAFVFSIWFLIALHFGTNITGYDFLRLKSLVVFCLIAVWIYDALYNIKKLKCKNDN